MSIFGFHFVVSVLREAKWPRKQGILGREVVDSAIADQVIVTCWAASAQAVGRRTRSGVEADS